MRRKNLKLVNESIFGSKRTTKPMFNETIPNTNYFDVNLAQSSQSTFVDYNVQNGLFFIDNAVTAESANTFIQNLKWFQNYQLSLAEDRRLPVMIYINTPGGHIDQAFAMINAIRSCPLHTIGVAQGNVYSAGIPILLACRTRISFELSEFMIHSLAGGVIGKYQDMKEEMIQTDKVHKRINDFIISQSEITQEMMDEITKNKTDKYFYPEEAVELGIIDEVIGDYEEYAENMREQQEKMAKQMQEILENGEEELQKKIAEDEEAKKDKETEEDEELKILTVDFDKEEVTVDTIKEEEIEKEEEAKEEEAESEEEK